MIKAITNSKNICYHCLKEFEKENLHKIEINALGYGSFFDNFGTSLQLCNDCYEKSKSIWTFNTIKDKDNYTIYANEKEIEDYIYSLPIETQELVFNTNAWGAFADDMMEPQDWIDYKIGILSHEKCCNYGLISKHMIEEFTDKYPRCEHVINISYNDGQVSSCCFNGSHGLKDGKIDKNDIKKNSQVGKCWNCEYFKERTSPYFLIDYFKDYKYYKIQKEYEVNQEKIKKLFKE